MQLNQLKPNHKAKKGRRVGRGGKRGTYSGRGMKGQKSRSGHKIRPDIRDLIKKLPKRRGYRFKSFQSKPVILSFRELEKHFADGSTINPENLAAKGLIRRISGKLPKVKILGDGESKKKFGFSDILFSKSAREKIDKNKIEAKAKSK